jgi:ligand-binding sensor domain-containing protein/signal transduction histidine kinase/DNA-binding response OmpR family regulator
MEYGLHLNHLCPAFRKWKWTFTGMMLISCMAFTNDVDPPFKLRFDQITSIQGLSNNTVYDIVQDAEGFIWIATREGLNKFDGQVVTSYYREDVTGIPDNFVEDLLVTSNGKLIVGTQKGACVYNKETNSFYQLLYEGKPLGDLTRIIEVSSGELLISSNEGLFKADIDFTIQKISTLLFRDICEYKTGLSWGLYENDILVLNLEGDIIRKYSNGMESVGNFDMSSANIERIYKDSKGKIWLGTKRDGIGYYNNGTDRFFNLKLNHGVNPIEDNFVRVISEDIAGRLWIGTESGLYIYDIVKEFFTFYGLCFFPNEKGLNDKAIYSIFRSRDNLMWIGTYFGGVNYTNLFQKGFDKIYADGGRAGLSGNAVSEIIEASDHKIWIATEDGGISILNPETGGFEYLKHKPGNPQSLSSNNVHALEEDKEGNIWIGTFIGGLNKYNKRTKRIERIEMVPPIDNMEQDVYSKSIFSIFYDSKDRIWVGTIEGLFMREAGEDEFRMWKPDYFLNNFVYHIDEDSAENIWICTYEQGIYKISPDMGVSNYRAGSNHDIRSNRIIFSFIPDAKTIWFGTCDGGLIKYDASRNVFKSYTEVNGLPNNTVYAITRDDWGYLWLSTNKGISMFDTRTEIFVNYSADDGLIGNQFNFKSGMRTSKGIMYFGAVNGLTFFDPRHLRKDEPKPDIHFTDFKISNNSVKIGAKEILKKHIDFQDEIYLDYKNKVFTIDFIALHYQAPKKVQYSYYLEGLESDWNYVGSKLNATYTNLSPGKYTFHLRATVGDQVWANNTRTLTIHIRPPFWISVWGYILYGFILLATTLLIIRFSLVRQKEKVNVQLAVMEKQKNEEISKHRLNFFTYISHEFKTPLTLIIATLDHILNYEAITPKFKDYGIMMRKNAIRLLFLINQLMDFRKIETDHASITYNKGDIIGFIKSTFFTFNPMMLKQSIKAVFTSNLDSYIVYFDADKLEKIMTNLISNSCKSFIKPGTISLDVKIMEWSQLANPSLGEEKSCDLIISIADDGPGLPQEKLEHIYKPFESGDPADFQSSGIGLSLVNSLVRYLNGNISFTSANGAGTSVKIQLPLVHNPSPERIKNDVFIESNTSFNLEHTTLFIDTEADIAFDFQDNGSVKVYSLLIVEDNKELASFLNRHYATMFKVYVAFDGEEAYEKTRKLHPDLIISDIMMPRMDGFALCNAVKDSIETSHIPIILLTSKSGDEARIEGLYKGADAYVAKPFSMKELDLYVRNILRSKERLRKHFATFDSLKEVVSKLGNKDQMFIKALSEAVNKNLDNASFNVDMFCREVNVSRTLMHMKVKKITGLSTTEFIKKIRMNEANRMLKENNLTVSEIAYKVGYNDPSYFSRSFKKMFGKNPTEINTVKT